MEVATSVSADLISEMAIDGLVGLGFDTLNDCKPTPCQTFIDNVAPLLPSPIFAAYLKRGAIGAYDFGFLDSDHYQGEITYTVSFHSASDLIFFTTLPHTDEEVPNSPSLKKATGQSTQAATPSVPAPNKLAPTNPS